MPLAVAFFAAARWPDPVADDAVEHALVTAAAAARAAWPGVEQAGESWAAYVGRRAPADAAPLVALARMRTSDLWAACAAAHGDPRAIAAIRERCFGALAGALRHVGATGALVDEIEADLLDQLFVAAPERPPRIVNYSGRGDLRSWLRSAAIRTALKKLGARRLAVLSDDAMLDGFASPAADPVLAQLKVEYRDDVKRAFQAAFAELTARDRTLLRQHYIDELTVDHLGAAYRVHRATAARWLASVRDALLAGTRAHLAAKLQLAVEDVDSILVVLYSQLDVSFARLVGTDGG